MSLYYEAAYFLNQKGAKPGSLKTLVFDTYESGVKTPKGPVPKDRPKKFQCNPRQVFGLLSSVIKNKPLLTATIKSSGILKVEKKLDMSLALLMVHDLLLTKTGRINCGKLPIKDAILRHKTRLKAELAKYKVKHKIELSDSAATQDQTPVRWIRLNPILTKGELADLAGLSALERVSELSELVDKRKIYKDVYIDNLYGLHPTFKVTQLEAYKTGKIIIQDRASCFPAAILDPKPGDQLVDACSAPGNKTTHLAALVANTPSITAFERDPRRAKILQKMTQTAGATCVKIQQGDFTDSDPESKELRDVTALLVDPSCSGSGIFGRSLDEDETNENGDDGIEESQEARFRLHKLSEFQYRIVQHALSFPSARRVVYSTCSIHAEENEHVVKKLLETPEIYARGWRLRERKNVLPDWPRRGIESEFDGMENAAQLADSCIRALPIVDGGIGFFAACFERRP